MQLITGEAVDNWVQYQAGSCNSTIFSLGALDSEGNLQSGVTYSKYNGIVVYASIAILKKRLPKALRMEMFRFPFEELKVQKIVVTINSINTPSIKLAEKLGFIFQARIPGIALLGGDLLYYTIDKDTAEKWYKKEK